MPEPTVVDVVVGSHHLCAVKAATKAKYGWLEMCDKDKILEDLLTRKALETYIGELF